MPWGLLSLVKLVASSWTAASGPSAPGGAREALGPVREQARPRSQHPEAGLVRGVLRGCGGSKLQCLMAPVVHTLTSRQTGLSHHRAHPNGLKSFSAEKGQMGHLGLRASSLVSRIFSHNASEPYLLIQNYLGNFPNRLMSRPQAETLVSLVWSLTWDGLPRWC